jgi:hypothetical protein
MREWMTKLPVRRKQPFSAFKFNGLQGQSVIDRTL